MRGDLFGSSTMALALITQQLGRKKKKEKGTGTRVVVCCWRLNSPESLANGRREGGGRRLGGDGAAPDHGSPPSDHVGEEYKSGSMPHLVKAVTLSRTQTTRNAVESESHRQKQHRNEEERVR
ncbi:hypothetical protein OUZ56_008513 [Daphnia magna]|uniref:Uncharacterized protein n=1 Tax=Daphnia magna TaxID=35525 RepID=A0ABR0ADG1_9CRUS|nr:hypothetical protein OUZ56_008513 [Daphnia magna]